MAQACVSDNNCPLLLECVDGYCVDPCFGYETVCTQYGYGHVCVVVNHKPQCVIACVSDNNCSPTQACIDGYCVDACASYEKICQLYGIGYTCQVVNHKAQCVASAPACFSDNNCSPAQACIDGYCVDLCLGYENICQLYGAGYTCQVVNHKALCVATALTCYSDYNCSALLACIDGNCVDPCIGYENICQLYGIGYTCQVVDHKAQCVATALGCMLDSSCPLFLACINGKCVDPCFNYENICLQYGAGYICQVVNHKPQCVISCLSEMNCPPSLACVDGYCVDACIGYESLCLSYGAGYICQVINHQPQCVATCISDNNCPVLLGCIDGYCVDPCFGFENICQQYGVGYVCVVVNHKPQCVTSCFSDNNCLPTLACIDGICVDPCIDIRCQLYGVGFTCQVVNHKPTCLAPSLTCLSELNCPTLLACVDGFCIDPCVGYESVCLQYGPGYVCQVINHQPQCVILCLSDVACPLNMACIGGHCVDPCISNEVCLLYGLQYICQVVNHKAQCVPSSSVVVYRECTSDQDCPEDKACKDFKCYNPCDSLQCHLMFTSDYTCVVENHLAVCVIQGDKKCYINDDCSWHLSCGPDHYCIDPCLNNICVKMYGEGAMCIVKDHYPICYSSYNVTLCSIDEECVQHETCMEGRCQDPCTKTVCPPNFICKTNFHYPCCVKYN
ncbi:uncharacterized protein LOC142333342 [Lycorma delicatula]|uniref:uncharacterized protein LOC142333342 n=1 Tax=Lycorma delicatula TaxID=130591 RepID=UPI003F512FF3